MIYVSLAELDWLCATFNNAFTPNKPLMGVQQFHHKRDQSGLSGIMLASTANPNLTVSGEEELSSYHGEFGGKTIIKLFCFMVGRLDFYRLYFCFKLKDRALGETSITQIFSMPRCP